jgi:hypothetical protein
MLTKSSLASATVYSAQEACAGIAGAQIRVRQDFRFYDDILEIWIEMIRCWIYTYLT